MSRVALSHGLTAPTLPPKRCMNEARAHRGRLTTGCSGRLNGIADAPQVRHFIVHSRLRWSMASARAAELRSVRRHVYSHVAAPAGGQIGSFYFANILARLRCGSILANARWLEIVTTASSRLFEPRTYRYCWPSMRLLQSRGQRSWREPLSDLRRSPGDTPALRSCGSLGLVTQVELQQFSGGDARPR